MKERCYFLVSFGEDGSLAGLFFYALKKLYFFTLYNIKSIIKALRYNNITLYFREGFMSHKMQQAKLVEIQRVIPNIILDIRYATKNNFTNEIVYPSKRAYLIAHVIDALKAASQEFNT